MPDQGITIGLVLFILAIIGALAGAWWRVEHKVTEAKKEAYRRTDVLQAKIDFHAVQLAEYKTHVAEHYVSKQGHREATDQILDAINRVNERLDRAFDGQRGRPPP